MAATGLTVPGPRGPVRGAIVSRELHADGSFERKVFAPGYGEFSTGSGGSLEALALAVPTDALRGPLPESLRTLSVGSRDAFEAVRSGRWEDARATVDAIAGAWRAHRARGVPPLIAPRLADALRRLDAAVAGRTPVAAAQAAIDLAQSALDLQLRHRNRVAVDRARLALWQRQLALDASLGRANEVRGDRATIRWIRDRLPGAPPR